MIIELTPIEETVCGKELIGIGVERSRRAGRQEGRQEEREALLLHLITAKFGRPAPALIKGVKGLSADALKDLSVALLKMKKVQELKHWLGAR